MAETFRKIKENAEGSKAHVRLDSLSRGGVVVDKDMRNLYLQRFNRMTKTLTDAGDSNTVMFTNGDMSMEFPKTRFANMVFDLRETIVSMGAGELADRIDAFHTRRRTAFLEVLNSRGR